MPGCGILHGKAEHSRHGNDSAMIGTRDRGLGSRPGICQDSDDFLRLPNAASHEKC